jgi:hypothetical protein
VHVLDPNVDSARGVVEAAIIIDKSRATGSVETLPANESGLPLEDLVPSVSR